MTTGGSRVHANTDDRDRDQRGRWVRAPKTAWKPGQSGNPNGRSVTEAELAKLARQLTPEAVQQLVAVMRDTKAQAIARVRAVEILFERAFGRAAQKITVENDVSGMSNPALAAYMRAKLEEMQRTIEHDPPKELPSE